MVRFMKPLPPIRTRRAHGRRTTESHPGTAVETTCTPTGSFNTTRRPSTVLIRASGDEGFEAFDLEIRGETVATFDVETEYQVFSYTHDSPVTANDIRIVYDNDIYDPGNGIDSNLNVDWIEVDTLRVETESSFIFSTGVYSTIDDTIQPGYGRGDRLFANGYFQFATGSNLVISVKGNTGLETLDLMLAGQEVASFGTTDAFAPINFIAKGKIAPDEVRIEYRTDTGTPGFDDDRSLTIDSIEIDGVTYETEAVSTYSSGTDENEGTVRHGFLESDTLKFNGFFQYNGLVTTDDTFSLPEDSLRVPLAVLANDAASEFHTLEIASFSDPENGTLDFVDGVLYYTPDDEFVGEDSFEYIVESSGGALSPRPVAVAIQVNPSHQQPQSQINPAVAAELTPSGKFPRSTATRPDPA